MYDSIHLYDLSESLGDRGGSDAVMDLFARFQKLAGPEEQKRFLSLMGNHPNGHSDALAREMFKVHAMMIT